MNRLNEIKILLNEYSIDDLNLFSEGNNLYTLDFLMNNMQNISDKIDIDSIQTDCDYRYPLSTYIQINNGKGYSVILDHSFEDNDLSTIDKAAEVILEYENLSNSLTLNYKTDENIN